MAQLVEQLTRNEQVVRSNRISSSIKIRNRVVSGFFYFVFPVFGTLEFVYQGIIITRGGISVAPRGILRYAVPPAFAGVFRRVQNRDNFG